MTSGLTIWCFLYNQKKPHKNIFHYSSMSVSPICNEMLINQESVFLLLCCHLCSCIHFCVYLGDFWGDKPLQSTKLFSLKLSWFTYIYSLIEFVQLFCEVKVLFKSELRKQEMIHGHRDTVHYQCLGLRVCGYPKIIKPQYPNSINSKCLILILTFNWR